MKKPNDKKLTILTFQLQQTQMEPERMIQSNCNKALTVEFIDKFPISKQHEY